MESCTVSPFDPAARSGPRALEAHARCCMHRSCLPGAPPSRACSQLTHSPFGDIWVISGLGHLRIKLLFSYSCSLCEHRPSSHLGEGLGGRLLGCLPTAGSTLWSPLTPRGGSATPAPSPALGTAAVTLTRVVVSVCGVRDSW